MTRKFAWWVAYGLAATVVLASGAHAEPVRLTAADDDLGWQDIDGKVRSSPVYFTPEDPPPPPKIKPKQGVGAGAQSLSPNEKSPSDKPPMKLEPMPEPGRAPVVEGPVQGYGPLQKEGYGAAQKGVFGPAQKEGYAPVQKEGGYGAIQKNGGYDGDGCGAGAVGCGVEPSCGYAGPGCGYEGAPSCGYDGAPSCGYDNASYGDCFCPTTCGCYRWAARAEVLFWERSNANAQTIATAPGGTINADDFNFGTQAGPRLSLFYKGFMDTCWDLELTYFGIHGWTETETLAGTTVIATTPVINIGGGAALTSTYHSRLDSSEINLRRQWNRWGTFLMGVRWIEEAEILNNDIGGAANHNINVNNHLYGFQLGFDTLLWNRGGPWTVEGLAKVGLYHINSDVTTTTAGVGGALPLVNAQSDDTALTADLGFTAVYQMSDYAFLRFGYNLFWIDGLAEAPAQMTTTDITTGVATVHQDTTQFYHGASIGIELRR